MNMRSSTALYHPGVSSHLRQLFKPRLIQQENTPVLLLDHSVKLPILQDLVDALTGGPDELGERLLRKMKFNRKTLLGGHAIGDSKHQQALGQALLQRLRRIRLEGGQQKPEPQAIPIINDVEGFMAYYVVYAPDDTVTAISIFNDYAGAEESNRRVLAWIERNLASLLAGPATAMAGPVIVHTLA